MAASVADLPTAASIVTLAAVMSATPRMTFWATQIGCNGRTRRVPVSLPYVEAIADEPHYQPPPARQFELTGERRGNLTRALVRRALGRDGSTTRRLAKATDRVGFEHVMRRIAESGR